MYVQTLYNKTGSFIPPQVFQTSRRVRSIASGHHRTRLTLRSTFITPRARALAQNAKNAIYYTRYTKSFASAPIAPGQTKKSSGKHTKLEAPPIKSRDTPGVKFVEERRVHQKPSLDQRDEVLEDTLPVDALLRDHAQNADHGVTAEV